MEILHISNDEINNLNKLVLNDNVSNTESDVFFYHYSGRKYVLKELDFFDKNKWDNKIRTLLSIDGNRDVIPNYFIKPEFLLSSNYEIKYWASSFFDGVNLNFILNNKNISFDIKKKYLRRIGYILKQMDYIRRNTKLNDFYIGDLNENNFIVDSSGRILICDIDSIKINGNKSSVSKYINPFSLFNKAGTSKYTIDNSVSRVSDYVVDNNTDLYCYNIMIMNFLSGKRINDITIEEFYRYLNYLNDIGIDHNMIEIFNKIILEEDNCNPCYYIDSLTEDKFIKARRYNV